MFIKAEKTKAWDIAPGSVFVHKGNVFIMTDDEEHEAVNLKTGERNVFCTNLDVEEKLAFLTLEDVPFPCDTDVKGVMDFCDVVTESDRIFLELKESNELLPAFYQGYRGACPFFLDNVNYFHDLEEDEYGITWRCWDKKPTDAQRKAVKWREEK